MKKTVLQLPSTAGRSSAMKCPRRSEQENLWSGGNAVDTRTPHFQLPPSGDDQHFSGSGPHAMDPDENLSQSEQISQGHSEGNGGEQEEGDGAASGKKKKSRGAHSLMSRHLRRKSLASVTPLTPDCAEHFWSCSCNRTIRNQLFLHSCFESDRIVL